MLKVDLLGVRRRRHGQFFLRLLCITPLANQPNYQQYSKRTEKSPMKTQEFSSAFETFIGDEKILHQHDFDRALFEISYLRSPHSLVWRSILNRETVLLKRIVEITSDCIHRIDYK
jgi:hypothetical protein